MSGGLIPVVEARRRIQEALAPLGVEQVPLLSAAGRVLARDVIARRTQPPFAVSAMDGWAVRAADLAQVPATLTHVGEVAAGALHDGTVGPGQAVRIFTGAPLPAGADAIAIQENVTRDGDRLTVSTAVTPGKHVRVAGLDFREGTVGLTAPRLLTARAIALAAAMNVPWLIVRRRPRVAILSTGNELVLPGEQPTGAQIVSSNTIGLSVMIRRWGGEPVDLGIARDDEASLRTALESAAGCDLLVTSGGASVGDHDLVPKLVQRDGGALDFWRIAMRPGKPLLFGRVAGGVPILGLPGNPVSTLVCAVLFLRSAIERMLGLPPSDPVREKAALGHAMAENDTREDYVRAGLTHRADGVLVATAFEKQDSSMLATVAQSDCLIVRPPHAPAAPAGSLVDIVRLDDGHLPI
ncbi:molybdopterin molybdotransferase MoeA [Zavarzinia sp. CC-PAN008]|uniref:molybdopterin molybdotransferase MoeA n=1 Tax=Zavarzinia sp. CC-PAN008 TaxID=3243332 RepID=UPI003F7423EF